MCTGAELAAAGAAAAGTAGTAAAGADAAATGAAALGGGLGSMSGLLAAPEAFAAPSVASAGESALAAAAPEMATFGGAPQFGAGGMGMLDAGGSTVAGAPQAANPFSIGLGNFQQSALGQGLGRAQDALGNYNKVQAGMNMMQPQQRPGPAPAARPPSMNQQPMQPLAPPMGGLLGGKQQQIPDGAKLMMMKRMGLLGGM